MDVCAVFLCEGKSPEISTGDKSPTARKFVILSLINWSKRSASSRSLLSGLSSLHSFCLSLGLSLHSRNPLAAAFMISILD